MGRRKSIYSKFEIQDAKILKMLFLVEVLFLLYAMMRDKSIVYLQISVVSILFSVLTFFITSKINADKYLIIWTAILVNCGFMVQAMSFKAGGVSQEVIKCGIAFMVALIAGVIFRYGSFVLSTEIGIYVITVVHFAILVIMVLFGTDGEGSKGARVNLTVGNFTVQPLEIVKVTYVFVMVSLLCKDDCKAKKVFRSDRELTAILFTGLTAVFFIGCSELGSLLVIGLVGVMLYLVYARRRKVIKYLLLLGGCCAALFSIAVTFLHDKVEVFNKVYWRFKYVATPELDATDKGYQYLQMKKAIAIGGLFGPDTSRYITPLTNEANDLVLCKLIQVCGFAMGVLMIGAFILLFREGNKVANMARDRYYGGLALGLTYVITFESVVHISYSVGIFPITGIPLYFMSQGFVSLTMGLVMVAFLIVISTGTQERSIYDEKSLGEIKESIFKPRRRKSRRKQQ